MNIKPATNNNYITALALWPASKHQLRGKKKNNEQQQTTTSPSLPTPPTDYFFQESSKNLPRLFL